MSRRKRDVEIFNYIYVNLVSTIMQSWEKRLRNSASMNMVNLKKTKRHSRNSRIQKDDGRLGGIEVPMTLMPTKILHTYHKHVDISYLIVLRRWSSSSIYHSVAHVHTVLIFRFSLRFILLQSVRKVTCKILVLPYTELSQDVMFHWDKCFP